MTFCNGTRKDSSHPYYQAPILDVLEEEEILGVFLDWERFPEKYAALGRQSKEWFDANLGSGLARRYVSLLHALAHDPSLTHHSARVQEIFARDSMSV